MGLGAQLGQGQRPLAGAGGGQDLLGDVGVGAGHPGGYRAQVVPGERGGVEVAAQVVAGLGGPEGAVLDALLRHRERERVRAADRRGRVLAPVDRGPAERGRDAADVLRVEDVHRAAVRADRAGQRVDVGLGGGGDDRAGVAQDDVGQERRLIGPWRRHHENVLFQRDLEAVPVVRPAEEHRVGARVQEPLVQREGGADLARAAERCQAAPPQPQGEGGGEALAGVQPQVQAEAQVAGAVAGQVPGGQERPRGERGQAQDDRQEDGQDDGVPEDHRGSPFWAARTALRRAVRAAPGLRATRGARSALMAATRDRGMEARGPYRSVARSRKRPVLVAFPGTVPLPRPGRFGARRGQARGAPAGGDRAFLEDPGAEPGQGGGRGQHQAQQPQGQAADGGQRCGRLGGQCRGQLAVAGDGPGADDADQGVAGQGVRDRGQGPDGQVPPARRGRDRVHEHARADGGQVQRPGAQGAAAVQGERDAQAGEDQGGGVGDRRLERGDGGQVRGRLRPSGTGR